MWCQAVDCSGSVHMIWIEPCGCCVPQHVWNTIAFLMLVVSSALSLSNCAEESPPEGKWRNLWTGNTRVIYRRYFSRKSISFCVAAFMKSQTLRVGPCTSELWRAAMACRCHALSSPLEKSYQYSGFVIGSCPSDNCVWVILRPDMWLVHTTTGVSRKRIRKVSFVAHSSRYELRNIHKPLNKIRTWNHSPFSTFLHSPYATNTTTIIDRTRGVHDGDRRTLPTDDET